MSTNTSVAVVSGGSQGIGFAAALRLARNNYHVLICGRDRQRLIDAKTAIGEKCVTTRLDVSEASQAKALIQEAYSRFGRVDVLVNNAACAYASQIETLSGSMFDSMIRTNVSAVFNTTQAVWPLMRQQRGGVIVNMSSLSAFDPFPGLSVYGATKAWVNLFSQAISNEGREYNIRVLSICPGAVDTPMLRRLFPAYEGIMLTPEDVASVIEKLIQPEFSHCSGESIRLKK